MRFLSPIALVALSVTARADTLTPIDDDPLLDRIYRYQFCPRGIATAEEYTRHCFYGPWPAQRDRQSLSPLKNPVPPNIERTCTRQGYERWIEELQRIFTPPI